MSCVAQAPSGLDVGGHPADGSMLDALALNDLYTSAATTAPGTGSISGGSSDPSRLQFVANGMFVVLTHEGSLTIE